jgi:hypothetical protein
MIYEAVDEGQSIRQGDIFRDIPRIDLSVAELPIVEQDGQRLVAWQNLLDEGLDLVTALIPIKRVSGIVITQDCDAANGQFISFAQIDKFVDVTKLDLSKQELGKQMLSLTTHARENLKWFYLPADEKMGFTEKMAADFRAIFALQRSDLQTMISLRNGRLNPVADEHFRETIAQYFRRYPYNEWYPLTKEELAAYEAKKGFTVSKYSWQV